MTDKKYKIDTEENKEFLRNGALRLLEATISVIMVHLGRTGTGKPG